jgi:hypothetical protein
MIGQEVRYRVRRLAKIWSEFCLQWALLNTNFVRTSCLAWENRRKYSSTETDAKTLIEVIFSVIWTETGLKIVPKYH